MYELTELLRKESISTEHNQERVLNYFYLRRLLEIMLDMDKEIKIFGSFAYPIHTTEFRLPSDIDIQTDNRTMTSRNLIKALDVMSQKGLFDSKKIWNDFDVSIVQGSYTDANKVVLPPVLSADKPLTIYSDASVDRPLAQAFIRGMKKPREFKGMFDIFSLSQAKNLDISKVRKLVEIHWSLENLDSFAVLTTELLQQRLNKSIGQFTEIAQSDKIYEIWEQGKKEMIATSVATPEKVRSSVKNLAKELTH